MGTGRRLARGSFPSVLDIHDDVAGASQVVSFPGDSFDFPGIGLEPVDPVEVLAVLLPEPAVLLLKCKEFSTVQAKLYQPSLSEQQNVKQRQAGDEEYDPTQFPFSFAAEPHG